MSDYTPEPWHTIKGIDRIWRIHSETVSHMADVGELGEYDARRIVACVNACKGISTETLESEGSIADIIANKRAALRDCVEALETAETYLHGARWTRHRDADIAQVESAITNARKALVE